VPTKYPIPKYFLFNIILDINAGSRRMQSEIVKGMIILSLRNCMLGKIRERRWSTKVVVNVINGIILFFIARDIKCYRIFYIFFCFI
jgi:hypothetical protein